MGTFQWLQVVPGSLHEVSRPAERAQRVLARAGSCRPRLLAACCSKCAECQPCFSLPVGVQALHLYVMLLPRQVWCMLVAWQCPFRNWVCCVVVVTASARSEVLASRWAWHAFLGDSDRLREFGQGSVLWLTHALLAPAQGVAGIGELTKTLQQCCLHMWARPAGHHNNAACICGHAQQGTTTRLPAYVGTPSRAPQHPTCMSPDICMPPVCTSGPRAAPGTRHWPAWPVCSPSLSSRTRLAVANSMCVALLCTALPLVAQFGTGSACQGLVQPRGAEVDTKVK